MNKQSAWIILLLLILAAALSLHAQTATVFGEVYYKNGKPAVNVTVSVGPKFAFTDVYGRYRIPDVPFGEQILQISSRGRKLKQLKVVIQNPYMQLGRIIL
jgi:hypothetical protein